MGRGGPLKPVVSCGSWPINSDRRETTGVRGTGGEMEGMTLVLRVCTEVTAFLSGGSMGAGRGDTLGVTSDWV